MAENDQAQQAPQQQFAIQALYTKDVSFEAPMGAELFSKEWQPSFNVDLNTSSKRFNEDSYEVVLSITVTISLGEQTAALVEVQQAGLFAIKGIEGEALRRVLGIVAPNVLFPYVRETIDSLCNRGGIPTIKLQPVNFELLYANAQQKAQQQAGASGEAAH